METVLEVVVKGAEAARESELTAVRADTMRGGVEPAALTCDVTTVAAMWSRSCEGMVRDAERRKLWLGGGRGLWR